MGTKKALVKLAVAGAVFAAIASTLKSMKEDGRAAELEDTANRLREKIAKTAGEMGALSKSAYDKVVDTTVAEYRGVKAMSAADLKELKRDLRASWKDIKDILAPEVGAAKSAVKKAAKAAKKHAKRLSK